MFDTKKVLSRTTLVSAILAAGFVIGSTSSQAAEPTPLLVAQGHDDGHDDGHSDHGDSTHGGPRWRGGGGSDHGGGHSGGGGHSDRGGRPEWAGHGGDHTVDDVVFHYRPGHDDLGDVHDHDEGGDPGSGSHMDGEDSHSHDG